MLANPVVKGAMIINAGTSVSIPTGTFTKLEMDTIIYDTEGCVDLANSRIIVPEWARFVRVQGHLTYNAQNVGSGSGSIHLWRDWRDGIGNRSTPEAHYHCRQHYTATSVFSEYCSMVAVTPWIPKQAANEAWTLYAFQASGGAVNSYASVENWLSVEFSY